MSARFRLCFLLALGLVSLLGAWSYEQIDTAGTWINVEAEIMPDYTIWVCYQDSSSGAQFVAHKEGSWLVESLGPAGSSSDRRLVVGPAGRPAIVLNHAPITYAVRTDTGWVRSVLPETGSTVLLAFDTLGQPTALWSFDNESGWCASTGTWEGGVWVKDTVWLQGGGIYDPRLGALTGFVSDRRGRVNWLSQTYSIHGGYCWNWVNLHTGRTADWTTQSLFNGSNESHVIPLSLAPFESSGVAACFDYSDYYVVPPNGFSCAGTLVSTDWATAAWLRIDARNRPQVVFRQGVLQHAFCSGQWFVDTLPGQMDVPLLDFVVDSLLRPTIAFRSPQGISLATGENEYRPSPAVILPGVEPSIARDRCRVEWQANRPCSPLIQVLDASGRIRKEYHCGALSPGRHQADLNLVGLSAGAYFIRLVNAGIPTIRRIVVLR